MNLNMPQSVLRQIRDLCVSCKGVETGGLVFGRRERQTAYAWFVTGPGPRARQEPRALLWDTSYILGTLEGVSGVGLVEPLGRWHKHVAPIVHASADDAEGATSLRKGLGLDHTFELIVATGNGDEPIAIAVYECDESGMRLLQTTEISA